VMEISMNVVQIKVWSGMSNHRSKLQGPHKAAN